MIIRNTIRHQRSLLQAGIIKTKGRPLGTRLRFVHGCKKRGARQTMTKGLADVAFHAYAMHDLLLKAFCCLYWPVDGPVNASDRSLNSNIFLIALPAHDGA